MKLKFILLLGSLFLAYIVLSFFLVPRNDDHFFIAPEKGYEALVFYVEPVDDAEYRLLINDLLRYDRNDEFSVTHGASSGKSGFYVRLEWKTKKVFLPSESVDYYTSGESLLELRSNECFYLFNQEKTKFSIGRK